jgi:hypothetical protein
MPHKEPLLSELQGKVSAGHCASTRKMPVGVALEQLCYVSLIKNPQLTCGQTAVGLPKVVSSGQNEELAVKSAEGSGAVEFIPKSHAHVTKMLLEALFLDWIYLLAPIGCVTKPLMSLRELEWTYYRNRRLGV